MALHLLITVLTDVNYQTIVDKLIRIHDSLVNMCLGIYIFLERERERDFLVLDFVTDNNLLLL